MIPLAIRAGGSVLAILQMRMATTMVSHINTFIYDVNSNKVVVGWRHGVVHADTGSTLIHIVFDPKRYFLQ
jgi:hypothetical protein